MWVKISIQETILLYLFPPLNRHNTKKNYHNKIRLSQRNPCKIKVFLGCPYYTAISPENIPELRNLVKGCLAQEFSNACDVLLWVFQQVRRHIVGCGHLHAAEFIKLEIFFMDAHPLLRKEHRAGIVHLNGNHDEQIQP